MSEGEITGVDGQVLTEAKTSANLRQVSGQFVETVHPSGSIRGAGGQYLTVAKTPANIQRISGEFLESVHPHAKIRGIGGQYLVVRKTPANVQRVKGEFLETVHPHAKIRRIGGQYLKVVKSPANVQGVSGALLETVHPHAKIRKVGGEYLKRDVGTPDFTKDPRRHLLDRINELNNTKFITKDVSFSEPFVSNHHFHNTRVRVNALPRSGYSGFVDVVYTRVPLSKAISWEGDEAPFEVQEGDTTHDLLEQINSRYSINLTPDDLLDEEIPDPTAIELKVNPKSYYFLPDSGVEFGRALNKELLVTDLSGFELPPIPKLSNVLYKQDLSGFELPPIPQLANVLTQTDLSGFEVPPIPTLESTLGKTDLSGFKVPVSLKSLFGG